MNFDWLRRREATDVIVKTVVRLRRRKKYKLSTFIWLRPVFGCFWCCGCCCCRLRRSVWVTGITDITGITGSGWLTTDEAIFFECQLVKAAMIHSIAYVVVTAASRPIVCRSTVLPAGQKFVSLPPLLPNATHSIRVGQKEEREE